MSDEFSDLSIGMIQKSVLMIGEKQHRINELKAEVARLKEELEAEQEENALKSITIHSGNREWNELRQERDQLREALRKQLERARKYMDKGWAISARELELEIAAILDPPKGEPDGYKGGLLK
jgi:uncharacterized small protein (DUF1192 family)